MKYNLETEAPKVKSGIPALIENIKKSNAWKHGELYSLILLRSPGKKIVLTALHEGTEIITLKTDDSVNLHVIEGKLKFQSMHESVILSEDQVFTINGGNKFSFTSLEETVFILTIIKGSGSGSISEHKAN